MPLAKPIEPPRLVARGWRLLGSRSGVMAVTTGGNLVVRLASSVILTRLLSPDAFGLVGIITAVFFTIGMLTDLGFQSYVVRHPNGGDRHFRNVIWTIHASRGVLITLIAVVLAPVAGHLLRKPELTAPFAVASLTLLMTGVSSLSMFTALREDQARRLSWLELGGTAFQAAAAVLLALAWRNVWAIIAAMLLAGMFRMVLSYVLFPNAIAGFARDKGISRDFFAFSRVVMMSSTVSLVMSQTDKLVLARLFTLSEFGLYAIALNLAMAPTTFADTYIYRVVFPVLSQTWQLDPGALRGVYYRMKRVVLLLYAFGCGGLIGGAGVLIAILYDPRYQHAAAYLSLLTVSTALRMPNVAAAELMTAIGRIKGTLYANIARLAWLLVFGIAGYTTSGTIGLIAAVGTVEIAPYLYLCAELRRRDLLDVREEGLFLACVAAGAAAGFAMLAVAQRLWPTL